jgi:hypothetical protein
MSKAFCSRSCKENYFQLIAIQVPEQYLKSLYTSNYTEEQIDIKLIAYANHHSWRIDLVKTKVKSEAISVGYIIDADKTSFDECVNIALVKETGDFIRRIYEQRTKEDRIKELVELASEFKINEVQLINKINSIALDRKYIKTEDL